MFVLGNLYLDMGGSFETSNFIYVITSLWDASVLSLIE
jgi:hypothetical protein